MDCDLTTMLANFAVTCDNRADSAMDRAAAARDRPKADDFPEYNRAAEAEARAAEAEAAAWSKRADYAREGLMYMGPAADDLAIQMDPAYAGLIAACQAAHRCVYRDPASDGTTI